MNAKSLACKNCRYWGAYIDGACDFVDTISAVEPDRKMVIKAYADDDQGLEAYLHTGPDFSCIHFKEKREAK